MWTFHEKDGGYAILDAFGNEVCFERSSDVAMKITNAHNMAIGKLAVLSVVMITEHGYIKSVVVWKKIKNGGELPRLVDEMRQLVETNNGILVPSSALITLIEI